MTTKKLKFDIIETTHLSQREFAELVGVSRITVNNWCRGKQTPSKAIAKLAKRQLAYLTVAHRMKLLPGDIPKMHRSNVEARELYIRASVKDAAKKLRQQQKAN